MQSLVCTFAKSRAPSFCPVAHLQHLAYPHDEIQWKIRIKCWKNSLKKGNKNPIYIFINGAFDNAQNNLDFKIYDLFFWRIQCKTHMAWTYKWA